MRASDLRCTVRWCVTLFLVVVINSTYRKVITEEMQEACVTPELAPRLPEETEHLLCVFALFSLDIKWSLGMVLILFIYTFTVAPSVKLFYYPLQSSSFLVLFSSLSCAEYVLEGSFAISLLPVGQFNSLYTPSAVVLIRLTIGFQWRRHSHPINDSQGLSLSVGNQANLNTHTRWWQGVRGLGLSSGAAGICAALLLLLFAAHKQAHVW